MTFKQIKKFACEEITYKYDSELDLRFILIAHNTLMNEKVNGGIRMKGYKNEDEALEDGLKLAQAMTFKNIIFDLPWGGGKAVIVGNPKKTKKFLHKIGEFVESFKGKFQTTIDMGFTDKDAQIISEKTEYVDSLDPSFKKGCLGPSSIGTGIGIAEAIRVAVKKVYDQNLSNKIVVIQGLGRVGSVAAAELIKQGAVVIGSDTNKQAVRKARKIGVKIVPPAKIFSTKCDVFSPCAAGDILNKHSVKKLKCQIIAGGANNQLESPRIAKILERKKILYIPDFVANSGGMLQSQCEYDGKTIKQAHQYVTKRIAQMVSLILNEADKKKKLPVEIAEKMVNDKIKILKRKKS